MFLSCLLRKLWRNSQIWQLCYMWSGNPVIWRFRNCSHSIFHVRKHKWTLKSGFLDDKFWSKTEKMINFASFFNSVFGSKFVKTKKCVFNRSRVEYFGRRKNRYFKNCAHSTSLIHTYIIIPTGDWYNKNYLFYKNSFFNKQFYSEAMNNKAWVHTNICSRIDCGTADWMFNCSVQL